MTQISTQVTFLSSKIDFPFEIEYINISEAFDQHHTFEITAVVDVGAKLKDGIIDRVLGEFIEIKVTTEIPKKNKNRSKGLSVKNVTQSTSKPKSKKPIKATAPQTHVFVGITDSLELFQQGDQRVIRVEGYGPTILMDSAPSFRAFSEKKVNEIAQSILDTYTGEVFKRTNLKINNSDAFSVQTQETDYQFLCRLADKYKGNFFYDGQRLHFAPLHSVDSDQIKLISDDNLFHVRASVNLSPLAFSVNAYNLLTGEVENETISMSASGNGLLKTAVNKSKVYPKANVKLNYGIHDRRALKNIGEELVTRQTNSMVTISGNSSAPNIKIGSILDISAGKNALPGFNNQDKFTVTHVNHSISGRGGSSYSNSFSGIPDNNDCPVNMPGAAPKLSGPLQAEVVSNCDPDSLGRVQVKFLQDEHESVSPWLRVLTPFTSKGGHFFLPEINEKVLVFFEDFNVEKSPFVMGSFYTAQEKAEKWKDDNNRKKGIATENIQILFDENNGCLTFNAKSIVMKTEEGISFDGGKEIKQEADNIKVDAKQKTELAGKQGVKVSGARIDLN